MIIIAKNADFSANNLGRIDIDVEISAEVQAMATAYGGLSTSKQMALQTFYNSMQGAGFWARMKKLYIPFLSPTLDKTFLNVLNNTVDWSPNSSIYSLNSYGILAASETTDGSTLPFSLSSILNSTWMIYSSSNKTSVANGLYMEGSINQRFLIVTGNGSQTTYAGNTSPANLATTTRSKTTYNTLFATVLPNSTTDVVKHAGYGEWTETSAVVNDIAITALRPFRVHTGATRAEFETSIYAIMDAITQAEYNQLLTIFDKLKADILG